MARAGFDALTGMSGEALLAGLVVVGALAIVVGVGLAHLVFTAARESRRPPRKDRP